MAIQEQRVCDWLVKGSPCGKPCEEPTPFSVQDARYEIDVCDEHVGNLLTLFERAFEIARPTGLKHVSGTRTIMKGRRGAFTSRDVRGWLKEQPALLMANGYPDGKISDTGRISQPLIDAYMEAHK